MITGYTFVIKKEVHIENGFIPVGAILEVGEKHLSSNKYSTTITPFILNNERLSLKCELSEEFIQSIGTPVPAR